MSNPLFSHLPRWELTARAKSFFSADLRSRLKENKDHDELRQRLPASFAKWGSLQQAQYLEGSVLLPGYILSSQGDRMSMAHSVEGRFPFLDHRVMEFANRLPATLKLKVLNEKYILKRALGQMVPEVIGRRPKQPYRAPESRSFIDSTNGRCRSDYVDELLSNACLNDTGLFNSVAVGKLLNKARSGQLIGAADNMAFVGILSTQLLLRQFNQSSGRLN